MASEEAHDRKMLTVRDFKRVCDERDEARTAMDKAHMALSRITTELAQAVARAEAAEAELDRVRFFPPCCYDDLGNEGRGCRMLDEADARAEAAEAALREIADYQGDSWLVVERIVRRALGETLDGE